ncbi:hypothetical protein H4R34_002347 [Dimargaris verticillata]|uniref:Fanconi anemia group D2 protein n=1 Tax=Dimargaris verticillata TaxID=2761393 RepID=A0A9W8B862_9FUNG|nr:hypothetical protein H4R34_002347 [Dimargaris verticillata]
MPDLLSSTLQQAGLCLPHQAGESMELTVAGALFRHTLSDSLASDATLWGQFWSDLQEYWESPAHFKMSLVPLAHRAATDTKPVTSNSNESLVRMLLGVTILQPDLLEYLLQKLPEYSDDDHSKDEISVTSLIIRQLRWLDHLLDPEQLTMQLMEIVGLLSGNAQRDVIVALPDIVVDSEHTFVAQELLQLSEQQPELTVAVLDALSNLQCNPKVTEKMQRNMLERLQSADTDDLPVMLKFLFQTVMPDDTVQLISRIRKNLDLASVIHQSVRASSPCLPTGNQRPEMLILDAIHFGLQFHKFIRDTWARAIAELIVPADHRPLDILVLCLLYGLSSTRKRVQGLLRKKLTNQQLTARQLSTALRAYGYALQPHFSTLLSLAESLMRLGTTNARVASAAHEMYQACFAIFDVYHRQEVVGALVTHIGSGDPGEVDTALAALLAITQRSTMHVKPFLVFIKGLLDYLDNLTMAQLRLLFTILGTYLHQFPDDQGLYDELHIFLRKQLSSGLEQYKILGIVGGVSLIQSLGRPVTVSPTAKATHQVGTSSQAVAPGQGALAAATATATDALTLRHALNLINLVIDCSRLKSWPCLAMAYDELSTAVIGGLLDQRLETWLSENVANSFADLFFCETTALVPSQPPSPTIAAATPSKAPLASALRPQIWYNLDTTDVPIALRLFQFLQGDPIQTDRHSDIIHSLRAAGKEVAGNPLACLCALFKLFQACEKTMTAGSLQDIDAPLGCGVLLFEAPSMAIMTTGWTDDMRQHALVALLAVINWFREILNAFADQTPPEMRVNVMRRLEEIVELHHLVDQLLDAPFDQDPTPMLGPFTGKQVKALAKVAAPTGAAEPSLIPNSERPRAMDGYLRGFTIDMYQLLLYARLKPYPMLSDLEPLISPAALLYVLRDLDHKLTESIAQGQLVPVLPGWCLTREYHRASAANSAPASEPDHALASTDICTDPMSISQQVFNQVLTLVPALWRDAMAAVQSVVACEQMTTSSQPGDTASLVASMQPDSANAGPPPMRSLGPESLVEQYNDCLLTLLTVLGRFFQWLGLLELERRHLLVQLVYACTPTFDAHQKIDDDAPTLLLYAQTLTQTLVHEPWLTAQVNDIRVGLAVHRWLVKIYDLLSLHLLPRQPNDGALSATAHTASGTSSTVPSKSLKPCQLGDTQPILAQIGHCIAMLSSRLLVDAMPRNTWGNGAGKMSDVVYLVQSQIVFATAPVDVITEYTNVAFAALMDDDEDVLRQFPLLNRKSFPVFYKSVSMALANLVQSFQPLAEAGGAVSANMQTVNDPTDTIDHTLAQMHQTINAWRNLVGLVRANGDSKDLLLVCLRQGKQLVTAFIQIYFPFMERYFRTHMNVILALFKPLQRATRMLQVICGHCKTIRDTQLTALVPPTRKALETLLYRVKTMFERNNCLNAFSLGSLKHRNLAGEEISSQMPHSASQSEVSEGEEDPLATDVGQWVQNAADRDEIGDSDDSNRPGQGLDHGGTDATSHHDGADSASESSKRPVKRAKTAKSRKTMRRAAVDPDQVPQSKV